eukprot:COSAG01_NODE_1168_length_11426_cov_339.595038_18_plen_88_part_00
MAVCALQLPSISDDTWMTDFQLAVLYFHVFIFAEYCVVHYAYRQKKKLKKQKQRDQEVFLVRGPSSRCACSCPGTCSDLLTAHTARQ